MDQKKIKGSIQQLSTLINEMPDFICIKDGEGRWLETNQFSLQLFQLEHVSYQGKTDTELISYSPFFREALLFCEESDKKVWESGIVSRCEEQIPQLNGRIKFFDVIKVPLFYPDGQRKELIVIGRDITERKIAEKNIKYLAYHDELTGLPNRRHLYEVLTTELLQSDTIAVLFIDLDRFKIINDSLGHLMGDSLLQKVSERLVECNQKGMVFRHSGDEFILVIPDTKREESEQIAQKIIEHLDKPFDLDGHEIYISPSIGICLSTEVETNTSAQELIKFADLAMYQAKQEGKNTFRFYTETIQSKAYTTLEMEMNLHRALERDELLLHYQPQIDLQSGGVSGMEALLRWAHPDLGFISPADFIPLAEETGLIVSIGKWVLYTACKQNKEWQEKGLPPFVVSVNLSARQFYQTDLVEMISEVLKETELDPQYLELEITESMTMDVGRSIKILTELKNLGVKISIDDFGTGYSSLAYLKKFPVDKLKIDQSFVRDCLKDSSDATIVQTIIAMAKNLNLRVVAEGVETKEHLSFLQYHLCHEAQGYFISKPLPLNELEEKFLDMEKTLEKHGIPQTINEQMWIEEALRMARQDLQDTIRLQQGMTFKLKEQNGKLIHTLADGELLRRMGFSPEQIIGKDLFGFLPIEEAERKLAYYKRAWVGESVNYEGEVNGIYYLAALNPIIRGGRVVEIIASCVDITERKQMEEAVQESERQLRALINAVPDCVFLKDGEGRWLEVNAPALRLFQLENISYKGKRESELVNYSRSGKDTLLQCKKTDEQAWEARETIRVEEVFPQPDGTSIIFDTIKVPVFDQDAKRKGLVVIGRDITERKRVEKALMEAEAKYRSLVEEALVGVYILQDGCLLYVNPRCAEIFGYLEEEMLGISVLDIIVPGDRPLLAKNIEERESGRVKSNHYQFQAIKKDGSVIDCEVHGTRTIYNGKPAIIGSLLDITERKKSEELLRKTDKLAVIGELAAGVAHEIRNPLTALKGFTQLLKSQNKENSSYYEIMLSELERINSIVSEFLLLAKPQVVDFKKKSVISILQDITALLQSEANKHNVQLVTEFTTQIPLINCEENQLKQVFINVLKNAIEATPGGGSVAVKVKFREEDNKVIIHIIDEGCGIPEKRLTRLGEPFYTTKEKGTGLGLTISYKIIENHGGTIGIKSQVDEGTEVHIVLPA
ncbi:EAL domain-containing protein [Aneurinibacillus tyrosinisolvens]|uniref:EAL domain-containing protein n=1 Tax=Aneurinibacillus tyrosinisolvens TaxID=1443435 RepID=UPI00069BB2EE|nr:EAL domain-containing protein [Aneurinibacillus tyrosinisolvens]